MMYVLEMHEIISLFYGMAKKHSQSSRMDFRRPCCFTCAVSEQRS